MLGNPGSLGLNSILDCGVVETRYDMHFSLITSWYTKGSSAAVDDARAASGMHSEIYKEY